MDNKPVPIVDSLDGIVRSLRGPSGRAIGGLFGRWDELVGEQVAAHVRPVQLDRGVLTVAVDEPAWATQLKFMMPTIIERLGTELSVEITDYEVRVDPRNSRGQRW